MSAAPMSMNRVVHGAVRRDLARLTGALAAVPDGDRTRAQQLERAFANLHEQLTRHHEGEDTHLWPVLAGLGVDRELLHGMEAEHQAMSQALAESRDAFAAFARTGAATDASTVRASLVRTTDVVDGHLRHEEDQLEPALAPHLDSAEWKAAEKKLRRNPPGVNGRFFAWLTDGMGNAERSYLRSTVPPPVVFVFARVFGRRYNRQVAPVWRG